MKYAFYPGCVSHGGCPELYPAAVKVAQKLGMELHELRDVGCNGAGVLAQDISDPINARTLAKAEALGMTLMTICSTCTGVISMANLRLKSDPEYRAMINREYLAEEGLEYKGTTEIKHMMWAIVEDVGLDAFKATITHPLKGLKMSPFYGCFLRRPTEAVDPQKKRRQSLEQIIQAVGADVVDISAKSKCCGFPLLMHNEVNALNMTGDHTSEARAKGADSMVTPCPLCHLELDGQQSRAESLQGKEINMPVLHLPQLIGLAMGYTPKELDMNRHIVPTKAIEGKLGVKV